MNLTKITMALATALLLCSAFLVTLTPAVASDNTTGDMGVSLQADDAPVTPPPSAPDTTVTPAPVPADAPAAPTQADVLAVTAPSSVPDITVSPAPVPAVTPVTPSLAAGSFTLATAVTHATTGGSTGWQADDAPVTPPPSAPEPPAPPTTPSSDPSFTPSTTPSFTPSTTPSFTPPTTPPSDPSFIPSTTPSFTPPTTPPSAPPFSSHHHHPWVSPYPNYPSYPYYSDPNVWPYPYARWSPYVNTYPYVIAEEPQPVYTPIISSFTANPSYIQPGQSALLTWTANDASNVTISPSVGSVPNTGVYTVMPAYTTTYTLTASGTGGSVTASTTITVAQYYSTYDIGSSVSPAGAGSTASAGTGGVFTSGLSAGSSPALNLWLLYALMIGLLAVAAGVIITLMVRKPAKAYIGTNTGTRAGYLSSSTAPAATLPASGIPMTTPLATGPSAKFTSEGGKEISLNAAGQSLGRSDLHGLAAPGKADLLSRQHFSLSYENGDYYIEDRGSTNGTRLNGSDIRGKGRQLLKDGDKIDLAGALTITFKS